MASVPPAIAHDCDTLKWFRALGKIAPHVKVANPHPDPLSAGGMSTWVAVGPGGVVTGVTNPVPSIGTLWVVPDYLITAISWVVVGQAKPPLPLQPLNQITVHLLCNLLIQFSFDFHEYTYIVRGTMVIFGLYCHTLFTLSWQLNVVHTLIEWFTLYKMLCIRSNYYILHLP